MLLKITLVFVSAGLCYGTLYDRFTGEVASDELRQKYEESGTTSTCTMEIADCDPNERRRVDGSCNSLDNPVRGTHFEPLYRVGEANYFNGSLPAKAVDGSDKKLVRNVRILLLGEGKSTNTRFTQAIPGYALFGFMDVGSIHDIAYFVINKTYCCAAEGKDDPQCTPNIIPEDDPIHRYSGIRCMNMTRPLTYADFGCTDDPTPSPIEQATGVFDLSPTYNLGGKGDSPIRSYKDGKLLVDIDQNGIIFPPNGDGFCAANQPGETRCFGNFPSNLLSISLLGTWYMRQHNYFASQLAAVNPSWDDETLFHTARDINIAFHMQVYLHEWLQSLTGSQYLIDRGVISNSSKHRDIYDSSKYPIVSLEYTFANRWFHTMQEGSANMYYPDGTFIKEFPYVNATARAGFFGVDNNMVHLTQHMFRQPCAKVDHEIDFDLAENGLSILQLAVDVPASDLHKNRLLGLAPYVDYLYLCTGHNVTSFDDLKVHMEEERVEQMKRAYDSCEDIDLLAGMWSENLLEGGSIPATLACLLTEYLKKAIQADRHWYERPNRPYAFTEAQLLEVRKSSFAGLLCNVGDSVTVVQPKAFHTISSDNPLTPCCEIPSIDFSKWADSSSCSDNSTTTDDTTSSADGSSSSSSSSDTTSNDSSSNSDASSSPSSSSDTTSYD